jgi:hypothetical protein
VKGLDLPPHRVPGQLLQCLARHRTGRLVISFQSIRFRPRGAVRSRAWITVSTRDG